MFKLTPRKNKSRVETVLHTFLGQADGGAPVAGLAIDDEGVLYGTTPSYGAHLFGVVFSLAPPAAGSSRWKKHVCTPSATVPMARHDGQPVGGQG